MFTLMYLANNTYINLFDDFFRRQIESGLFNKYKYWTDLMKVNTSVEDVNINKDMELVTFEGFESLFYMYLAMVFVSVIAFIMEIFAQRFGYQ